MSSGGSLRIPAGSLLIPNGGSPPPAVTVELSLDTWDHWLAIAKEMVERAEDAHAQLLSAHSAAEETTRASALEEEFRTAMISIAAQAFAVDALYASVKERIPAQPTAVQATSRAGSPRYARITDTLRRGCKLRNEQVGQIRTCLKELFKYRDWAVHPPADFRQAYLHEDLALGVEWRFIAYSARNARLLFDMVVKLLGLILGSTRDQFTDLQRWAESGQVRLRHVVGPPAESMPTSTGSTV